MTAKSVLILFRCICFRLLRKEAVRYFGVGPSIPGISRARRCSYQVRGRALSSRTYYEQKEIEIKRGCRRKRCKFVESVAGVARQSRVSPSPHLSLFIAELCRQRPMRCEPGRPDRLSRISRPHVPHRVTVAPVVPVVPVVTHNIPPPSPSLPPQRDILRCRHSW